jgi:hypothetical protein
MLASSDEGRELHLPEVWEELDRAIAVRSHCDVAAGAAETFSRAARMCDTAVWSRGALLHIPAGAVSSVGQSACLTSRRSAVRACDRPPAPDCQPQARPSDRSPGNPVRQCSSKNARTAVAATRARRAPFSKRARLRWEAYSQKQGEHMVRCSTGYGLPSTAGRRNAMARRTSGDGHPILSGLGNFLANTRLPARMSFRSCLRDNSQAVSVIHWLLPRGAIRARRPL